MAIHFVIDTNFFPGRDTNLPKDKGGYKILFDSCLRLLNGILRDPEFVVYIPRCIMDEIENIQNRGQVIKKK